MKQITFITSNSNKAKQVEKYLGIPVHHKKIELDEIQSLDLEEVVTKKAKEAYKKVGSIVLVEDVSFVIEEFGKLPGPFAKFFGDEIGGEKICRILDLFKNRSARVEIIFALFDGKRIHLFKHIEKGSVAKHPAGKRGFGFDFIFIPKGFTKTRGEMSEKDYDKTSHRKLALEQLEKYIKTNNF